MLDAVLVGWVDFSVVVVGRVVGVVIGVVGDDVASVLVTGWVVVVEVVDAVLVLKGWYERGIN